MFRMDNIVITTIVVVAVCIGMVHFPRKWFVISAKPGSETYYIAFVHVLQLLQASIAILFLIGIVFMELRVVTILWFFYEAFYLPSVIMVFLACPVLTLAAAVWGIAGWLWLEYGLQAVGAILMLVLTAAINFGLYFTFEGIRL